MTTTTDLLRRAARAMLDASDDTSADQLRRELRDLHISLLSLAYQMERAEPVALTAFQKSAPERVWINVFGTEDDYPDGFPANHEDITWAEDEVGDLDIPYVRADLANPAPEVTRDAERYRWLRPRIPGRTYRIMGVIYSEGGAGVDAAIDAAMQQEQAK